MEYHLIYKEISELALDGGLIEHKAELQHILDNEGISVSDIKKKYKLTMSIIEKVPSN